MEIQLRVDGMTCGHCVQAVTGAVRAVAGEATEVAVDLDAGTVTINGPDLDGPALVDAITEAGYEPVA
jgi:copper chaperone